MKPRTHKPAYIPSLLQLKCPRCRQGDMFISKHSYSRHFRQMHTTCPVCGQPMEIEEGFYYGTGYVSYALAVAVSVASFVAWYVIIGMSLHDNRFFWWMGFNAVLLVALQPYLMRLSRTIWLSFFVRYKPNHEEALPHSAHARTPEAVRPGEAPPLYRSPV